MKFFKNSLLYYPNDVDEAEYDISFVKYSYIYNIQTHSHFQTHTHQINFLTEDYFKALNKNLLSYDAYKSSSKELLVNQNRLVNMLVKGKTRDGNKLTAYNLIKQSFFVFFSFFEYFTPDLNETYRLYNMYYMYSIENQSIFYQPLFIYKNMLIFLESTFTLSIQTPQRRSKRIEKRSKELSIMYVIPKRRIPYAVKMTLAYANVFDYRESYLKFCYSLLNTFLSQKNSTLFKKKIAVYDKLLGLKKLR